MTDHCSKEPPVSVKATNVILNPWYALPSRIGAPPARRRSDAAHEAPEITPPCRVELKKRGLRLFFRNNEIVFAFTGDSAASRYFINPIRYFLTYKTFIDYNMIRPADALPDKSAFDEAGVLQFKVRRFPIAEKDDALSGKTTDEWIEVEADSLTRYLDVLDETLYYALVFYLSGCGYPQFFLINFEKAIEKIRAEFGSRDNFLYSLEPYGVVKEKCDEFGKFCGDNKTSPLNIRSHAPLLGAPSCSADIRKLLLDPRSREVFESATDFCRQAIDAYMAFLTKQSE